MFNAYSCCVDPHVFQLVRFQNLYKARNAITHVGNIMCWYIKEPEKTRINFSSFELNKLKWMPVIAMDNFRFIIYHPRRISIITEIFLKCK